jgi:hypothetical protein
MSDILPVCLKMYRSPAVSTAAPQSQHHQPGSPDTPWRGDQEDQAHHGGETKPDQGNRAGRDDATDDNDQERRPDDQMGQELVGYNHSEHNR